MQAAAHLMQGWVDLGCTQGMALRERGVQHVHLLELHSRQTVVSARSGACDIHNAVLIVR